MSNVVLEQYAKHKKSELINSPFNFFVNPKFELNPHQVSAFCKAINSIKTGGIILADEVGLGKTIEAGLILKYILKLGAKRILITLPVSLRKQWEIELEDKFNINSIILDRVTVENDIFTWKKRFDNLDESMVILTSYDYSSKFIKRFSNIKWDLIIIDEAHNLRNVFSGTKRAENLYKLSKGIPKILLTATPLQNSLSDLHGLVSFIDPKIFGNEKIFNYTYIKHSNYTKLKDHIKPVINRTLRKDVAEYVNFKKRICKTIDFNLSDDEIQLYEKVNIFLKQKQIYSIPSNNRNLVILVIRKLLASSSFALIETFEVLRNRLEKLYKGTKILNSEEGFELFWDMLEDEISEIDIEKKDEGIETNEKKYIMNEIEAVDNIIQVANRIKSNSKIEALKTAIKYALMEQKKLNIPEKILIFTESKRTQKYIFSELINYGYMSDEILLFNGDCNDSTNNWIYRQWKIRNKDNVSYSKNIEYKHAIMDYFKNNSKILICTDAGSEGLNLQFCNVIINYDLPWNPMKIEQRIGRCHRYGQENDVITINLLNTQNAADKRVYEILSKKFKLFEDVFGSSDISLGVLESGENFEKIIFNIYQNCTTNAEFKREFDKLNRRLVCKKDSEVSNLKSLLLQENTEVKNKEFNKISLDLSKYLEEFDYWTKIAPLEIEKKTHFWKTKNWGMEMFGAHGFLFIGAFCNSNNMLFPVLLICDDSGEYIDFEEKEIVNAIKQLDDYDIHYFSPNDYEKEMFNDIYEILTCNMIEKYKKNITPILKYNEKKIYNWESLQVEQLFAEYREINDEIEELENKMKLTDNKYEKNNISKKLEERLKYFKTFKSLMRGRKEKIKDDAKKYIAEFNEKFEINPFLLIDVILKF